MILMIHPVHGQKHCYSENEAAADEGRGWVRYVPPAPVMTAVTGVARVEVSIPAPQPAKSPKTVAKQVSEPTEI